jgi:hypothetical protein
LDGKVVSQVNPDLTAGALNLTEAKRMSENRDISFMGDTKSGAFDISGDLRARLVAVAPQSEWPGKFGRSASLAERS